MRSRICLFICFISVIAVSIGAQTRSVTNADLEKFKLERLKAEAEYRENYARWGFPSPEELDRRREQSRVETEQLSTKLRAERLERERLEAERQASEQRAAVYYRFVQAEREPQINGLLYFWSYGRRYRYPIVKWPYQSGYFAGGQFWPTGSRTRPQPMWVRPRR